MKHHNVPRFTHTFLIYEGHGLPDKHLGKLFGVAPLLSYVVESEIVPDGSTFKTTDIGHPVTTKDQWFRPVDIKAGPDGALYIADWYDRQTAHTRNYEGQIDKTTGRIYRLRAKGAKPLLMTDCARLPTSQLVELLKHPDKWHRQTALRLLGDRRDRGAIGQLTSLLASETGQTALEALWGLNLSGGFDEATGARLLDHAEPFVRLWAARLLGDTRQVSTETAAKLAHVARIEPNLEARCQLAATARRLPAAAGLPIIASLLSHDEDASDPQQPLLVWWALEGWCGQDRYRVFELFTETSLWKRPLVAQHLVSRLMQRLASTGNRADLVDCARLLELAPDNDSRAALMRGFEAAFKGRTLTGIPEQLSRALEQAGGGSGILAMRRGNAEAIEQGLKLIADAKADASQRLETIQTFGEVREPRCVGVLLALLGSSRDDTLRMAALAALGGYDDPAIGPGILDNWSNLPEEVRQVALSVLAGRKGSALALLTAIDRQSVDRASVPLEVARRMTVYRDEAIARLIARLFGTMEGSTTAQMQGEIERLTKVIKAEHGDPYAGKKLFTAHCAKCHTLFAQGGQIGPDLTPYKRDDLDTLLLNIVNPSAEIREGFETLLVITGDGRTASGFLVDRDSQVLVLRGADGQNVTIPQSHIDETQPQRRSLMPEGLLKDLSEQQIRDLFSYLRSSQPLNE